MRLLLDLDLIQGCYSRLDHKDPVGGSTDKAAIDFSLTFPKKVRDFSLDRQGRARAAIDFSLYFLKNRGYERWRLPTKEGGGAPKERMRKHDSTTGPPST